MCGEALCVCLSLCLCLLLLLLLPLPLVLFLILGLSFLSVSHFRQSICLCFSVSHLCLPVCLSSLSICLSVFCLSCIFICLFLCLSSLVVRPSVSLFHLCLFVFLSVSLCFAASHFCFFLSLFFSQLCLSQCFYVSHLCLSLLFRLRWLTFSWWGCCGLFFDINQPSWPTPLYSVLVSISVFMALSTVFRSINSPDNALLSHSVLIGPFNYLSLYESLL